MFFSLILIFQLQAQSFGGIVIDSYQSCKRNIIEVEIRTDTWQSVVSMQFALQWDTNAIEYVETLLPNTTFEDLLFNYTDQKKLNISWFDNTLEGASVDEEVIFTIRFYLLGDNVMNTDLEVDASGSFITEFTHNNNGDIEVYVPDLTNGYINILELPVIDNVGIDHATNNTDGSISLDISQGQSPYTVAWLDGTDDANPYTNLSPGDYYCTVTDANGCSSHGGPYTVGSIQVASKEIESLQSFEINPNPATDIFHLEAAFLQQENVEIKLMDALGRTWYKTKTNQNVLSIAIDTEDFPAGLYFVALSTEQGNAVRKLMIAK